MSTSLRIAGATIAIALVVLSWYASAGPHLFDAGELVQAAWQLGGSHPPGQPLHALVGHAASLLVPLGPIHFRIACASAVLGGAAAWQAARIVDDALGRAGARDGWTARLLPAASALGVLGAPAVLPQLTRPEVYTLALALVLTGARRLIAWACRDSGGAAGLRTGALCAGLAIATHPPHALVLLAIGAALWLGMRRDARTRSIGWAALACTSGIAVIVYLPIRALAGAPMWGDPSNASGLWTYLSGAAYAQNLGTGGARWTAWIPPIQYVIWPCGAIALLAGIASIAAHRRWARSKSPATNGWSSVRALALAAPASLVATLLQPFEPANPDNIAYAAPAMVLSLLLAAAALACLRAQLGDPAIAAASLAIAMAPPLAAEVRALRADLPALETLAFSALDAPPLRALVIVQSDFVAAAWMEARATDGARPDVALLVEGLATSSWHWRTLANHPLFDGSPPDPVGDLPGPARWVRGAVQRALGRVAIASEGDGALAGRGVVLGPYLLIPTTPLEGARADRAFAERNAGAPARMIPYSPPSFGGHAHGVLRELEITRAHRLLARDVVPLALAALHRASAPLDPRATAAAADVSGSPVRAPPPTIRDPSAIFATAEDAVRELACVLVAIGAPARAVELLEAQSERDPRALLQLAAIQAGDGLLDEARRTLAAFRATAPHLAAEADALSVASR